MTAACWWGCGAPVTHPGQVCDRCWDAEQDRRHPEPDEDDVTDRDGDRRLNEQRERVEEVVSALRSPHRKAA